jgi:hypothetical protein
MYDRRMESGPGTGEVIDLAGGSLGEDIAAAEQLFARLGARLAAGEHRSLQGAEQTRLVSVLNRAGGLGEAAEAVLVHAAHSSGDLARSGFFSVRRFYVDSLGVSTAQAGQVAKLGRALDKYPRLRIGVLAGRICPDSARAAAEGINTATSDLRGSARTEAQARGEGIILGVCESGTTRDVEQVAASLIFHLDPEAAARKALEALEKREIRVGTIGATAVVRMVLDAMTAARLVEVLEARVDQWFRAGALPEQDQPTGDADEDERRRSMARPRLLAEAFAELVAEMLTDAGSKHGNPANVTVLASADVHANGGPGEILIPGHDPVPVPSEVVEETLCDATITDIHVHGLHADRSSLGQIARSDRRVREAATTVHPEELAPHDTRSDNAGDPHDLTGQGLTGQCAHVHCVARRSRSATRDQRAALTVRDRHCRFPGCRVDAARCIAHHVREWEHGGATCLSNLILLCPRHHGLVHRARWRIIADPGLDPGHPERWRFFPPETGYVGRDGALLSERLRRGHQPEPPPRHTAA